jgi:hypothetical protein
MVATLSLVIPSRPCGVALRYPVGVRLEEWLIPEGTVSESVVHDQAALHLQLLLRAWIDRTGRSARVARNLAIRFLESHPGVGIDPDLCLVDPVPEGFGDLGSLRLWQPGHAPPPFCIEVASTQHPNKDYTSIQDRYAALGCQEVAIFDPTLAGPRSLGGPVFLQLWRRDALGVLERASFGAEPAYSQVIDAWLVPDGRVLEIADDRDGKRRWLTGEALVQFERVEKEREHAARLDLERRLAELQAQLRR